MKTSSTKLDDLITYYNGLTESQQKALNKDGSYLTRLKEDTNFLNKEWKSKIVKESTYLYTTTVGDMISGYIDNMPDDQIDRELRLMSRIGKFLGLKNYDDAIVYVTEDSDYDPKYFDDISITKNVASDKGFDKYTINDIKLARDSVNGNVYLFFANEDDFNKYIDMYERYYSFLNMNESLQLKTESMDNEKIVIYNQLGDYYTTPESNYNSRISDARKNHLMKDFTSPDEIMDYYIKYGWAKDRSDFIVMDNRNEGLELKTEDTVKKKNGKWTNRGDDGTEHGEFDTKKKADDQRKAMYANGYKGEELELKIESTREGRARVNKDIYYMDASRGKGSKVWSPDDKYYTDKGFSISDDKVYIPTGDYEFVDTDHDIQKIKMKDDRWYPFILNDDNVEVIGENKKLKTESFYEYDEDSDDDRNLYDGLSQRIMSIAEEFGANPELITQYSRFDRTIEDLIYMIKASRPDREFESKRVNEGKLDKNVRILLGKKNKVVKEDLSNVEFNDKYFPRIDLTNKQRYNYYKYRGKDFAYDNDDALVHYLFKDPDEGKDAPWRELDTVGLSRENWKDKESRNSYLDGYVDDLDAEAAYAIDNYLKYEYKPESVQVQEDLELKVSETDTNKIDTDVQVGDEVTFDGGKNGGIVKQVVVYPTETKDKEDAQNEEDYKDGTYVEVEAAADEKIEIPAKDIRVTDKDEK